MKITSKTVIVDTPAQEVFHFLLDMNNLEQLLPEDKISNWQSSMEKCSFKVQNTATIEMVQKDKTEPNKINIVSGDKSPFSFTLDIFIEAMDDNSCKGYQEFNGDVNPFLKMMIEKPLTNLFNHIADRLKEVKSAS